MLVPADGTAPRRLRVDGYDATFADVMGDLAYEVVVSKGSDFLVYDLEGRLLKRVPGFGLRLGVPRAEHERDAQARDPGVPLPEQARRDIPRGDRRGGRAHPGMARGQRQSVLRQCVVRARPCDRGRSRRRHHRAHPEGGDLQAAHRTGPRQLQACHDRRARRGACVRSSWPTEVARRACWCSMLREALVYDEVFEKFATLHVSAHGAREFIVASGPALYRYQLPDGVEGNAPEAVRSGMPSTEGRTRAVLAASIAEQAPSAIDSTWGSFRGKDEPPST